MAVDRDGNLYVATRMGVQVADRNGRVRAILTLPEGGVTSLCFGGADFDTLYIVCDGRLYKRKINVVDSVCGVGVIDVFNKSAFAGYYVRQCPVGLAAAVYSAVVEMDSQVV